MSNPNLNLNEILDQIKRYIAKGRDDFDTFFDYNGKTVLVSLYKSEYSSEYREPNIPLWELSFREEGSYKEVEIRFPLANATLSKDDAVNIIIEYIKKGYLEKVIGDGK